MGKLRLIFLVTPSSPIGSPAVFDDGVFRGFAMKFLFPAPSIKKVDTWNYLKNGKMRFFFGYVQERYHHFHCQLGTPKL